MVKSSRRQAASWNPWLAGLSAAVPVALAIVLLPATAATAGPAATGRAVTAAASQDPGSGHLTPSGTDASCPAATTAGAGSSTVGAPADVRAIGGAASATVVWCPPATGAAKVVSYTVTSSGGQTVTATVPNDWAIVRRPVQRHRLHVHRDRQHLRRRLRPRGDVERRDAGADRAAAHRAARQARAGQLRPVLAEDRREPGLRHRRGVRPVAYPVALAVARRPAEDEGRRLQRRHGLLRLGLHLALAGRLRLRRRARHERVPEPRAAGRPLRDRTAGPVHQRGDRRRRHPVLGAHQPERLPQRHRAVPVRRAAVVLRDRLGHRAAPDHQRRRRDPLPDRERVHRHVIGRPGVHGRPGAAGHLGRDRRAVHVQPVLRLGHVHHRHRRGEHQRAGQLPARLRLRRHQQLRPALRLPELHRRAGLHPRVPGRLVRRLGRLGLRRLLLP